MLTKPAKFAPLAVLAATTMLLVGCGSDEPTEVSSQTEGEQEQTSSDSEQDTDESEESEESSDTERQPFEMTISVRPQDNMDDPCNHESVQEYDFGEGDEVMVTHGNEDNPSVVGRGIIDDNGINDEGTCKYDVRFDGEDETTDGVFHLNELPGPGETNWFARIGSNTFFLWSDGWSSRSCANEDHCNMPIIHEYDEYNGGGTLTERPG